MNRNQRIDYHINAIAQEVFGYISEKSDQYRDGWVPTAEIKNALGLNIPASPKSKTSAPKGWLFGIAARRLEDVGLIEYDNTEARSFCRVAGADFSK